MLQNFAKLAQNVAKLAQNVAKLLQKFAQFYTIAREILQNFLVVIGGRSDIINWLEKARYQQKTANNRGKTC